MKLKMLSSKRTCCCMSSLLLLLSTSFTDKAFVNGTISTEDLLPAGSILPYAGEIVPDDYLECNGAEIK